MCFWKYLKKYQFDDVLFEYECKSDYKDNPSFAIYIIHTTNMSIKIYLYMKELNILEVESIWILFEFITMVGWSMISLNRSFEFILFILHDGWH